MTNAVEFPAVTLEMEAYCQHWWIIIIKRCKCICVKTREKWGFSVAVVTDQILVCGMKDLKSDSAVTMMLMIMMMMMIVRVKMCN